MILLALAAFFVWLAYRELVNPAERRNSFSWGYMSVMIFLAVMCAKQPYKVWRMETFLSEKAAEIANRPDVTVRCNSVFGTIFGGKGLMGNGGLAGTAYFDSGEIFFENGWCKTFMNYMDNPKKASLNEAFSMQVFVHEVMHIKGERNEIKTECQALQRHHTVSEMLGVDRSIAERDALRVYKRIYPRHPYYSSECKPKGKYDERLADSIWDKTR